MTLELFYHQPNKIKKHNLAGEITEKRNFKPQKKQSFIEHVLKALMFDNQLQALPPAHKNAGWIWGD